MIKILGFLIGATLILPGIALATVDINNVQNLVNLSLEELLNMPVLSSTLKQTTQKVSPGNPYVITADETDKMGAISIADVIDKMVPGINIAMYDNFNELVSVRGQLTDSNLKTLLMSDGVDIGDHNNSGFSGADIASLLIGDLDRIEVSLGPGSLQLGSGAINGYINRISSTGASKPGLRVKQEYVSGNGRLTELSYGKVQNDDLNWFIYGGYYRNDGVKVHKNLSQQDMIAHQGASQNWQNTSPTNVAPSDTYYKHVQFGKTDDNYRLSSRVQYGSAEREDLLSFDIKSFYSDTTSATSLLDHPLLNPATGRWVDEVKAILTDLNFSSPGGSGSWGTSPFLFYRSQVLSVSPQTVVRFNLDNTINLQPFYQKIVEYEYPSDWLKDQVNELGLDSSQLKKLSFGYESRYGIKGVYNNTSFEHHDISLGAEWRHTDYRASHDWNGGTSKMWDFESTDQVWEQYSIFGEDNITLGKLSIIPGLRYDILQVGSIQTQLGTTIASYKNYHLTPRLAGTYQLSKNDTIKASYSQGIRFVDASVWQWFYDHPYAGQANPNNNNKPIPNQPDKLLPEVSRNFEITYDKYLPKFKIKCDVTTYYNIIRHERGWFDLVNNYANASKDIQGIGQEYMIKYLPSEKMEAFLAYGWSRPLASFETTLFVANKNNTWAKYPEQMFKAGGDYTIGKFTFGTLMKLISGAYVHNLVTDPIAEGLYGGWTLEGDINVKYALTTNVDIKLTIKDLIMSNFNQYYNYWQGQYPAMGLRAQNPRVYVSVDYKF